MIINLKKGFIKTVLSSAGMSLMEMTIGLAFIGGATAVGMKVMQTVSNSKKNAASNVDLNTVRTMIMATLQNEASFQRTLEEFSNTATFSCLKTEGTGDCTGASGEFKIYKVTATGNVQENPHVSFTSEPTRGFTATGTICNDFNPTPGRGKDSCPYKYVASWTPICPKIDRIQGKTSVETKCHNPLINVNVKLHFNPANIKNFSRLNVSRTDINIVLAQAGSDKNKLCSLAGSGLYNEATQRCVLMKIGKSDCDKERDCGPNANSLVEGFYEDGSLKCTCTPVSPSVCRDNQVVHGVENDGSLRCGSSLINGLAYSGNIRNTPQKLLESLQQQLAEARAKTAAAKQSQVQARNNVKTAEDAKESADLAAQEAQQEVNEARANAGGQPTKKQEKALEKALAKYQEKLAELVQAEANLDRARIELEAALTDEEAARARVEEQLAKM